MLQHIILQKIILGSFWFLAQFHFIHARKDGAQWSVEPSLTRERGYLQTG